MSQQTKWDAYVVEAYTDRDGDVTRVGPGELHARTPEPVALGTSDLVLELAHHANGH